jgi:hypothetical protein
VSVPARAERPLRDAIRTPGRRVLTDRRRRSQSRGRLDLAVVDDSPSTLTVLKTPAHRAAGVVRHRLQPVALAIALGPDSLPDIVTAGYAKACS